MSQTGYDVIVVGARCAGSPTAMLLAQQGHRVLVVDRSTFPSDTISTHVVHPTGVAALARWGLLDEVVASGCPPLHTYAFDFGPVIVAGSPGTAASPVGYCPRRTILDQVLVEAAVHAGAEVREGFFVEGLTVDDDRVTGIRGRTRDGASVTERARWVIGADGLRSLVARSVHAQQYRAVEPKLCGYYAYWSGLLVDGRFEVYDRGDRGFAAAPTNDGLTLLVGGWPFAELEANNSDVEGNYLAIFDRVPEFAARLHGATRESRVTGMAVPNFFRMPYGPGWALVGDAGYNKDPITAQGISDAFRDAELLAAALDDALTGRRPADEALAPELERLLGAMQGNQEAMDGFARVNAGVTSPTEFFAEENVARIMGASMV
jgi:2-polyprenyl-6-methoxyphenol hydroxylase-like FAD-dependent oxidoreductase